MSSQSKSDKMDFTTGNIFGKMVGFMLPIFGALILQTMYGAVDILVVGWFGTDESISAVSTGSSLINLVVFVLNGLAMGVTVLMGRYIGEKRQEKLGKVIGGAIAVFILLSVIVAVILLTAAGPLARLMQAPTDAFDKTVTYVKICGGGIIFIVGYNLISSIFRGIGNAKLPLLFVGIACVVNIFADLLFVAGFKMDVAGAALATVMAQAISLILSVMVCRKIELPFKLKKGDIGFNSEVPRFLKLGLPIAFQELLTQVSFMCLIAFVNGMGTTPDIKLASSSGYGIANKLVSVVMLVPSALMQSMSSFVAQNVGAGKESRARKALVNGMLFGAAVGVVMTAMAFFGGEQLASLFTENAAYKVKAAEYLKGFSAEAILTSILFSFIGYYNGHNKTLWVMIQGLAQSFIVRLPMAYAMSRLVPDSLFYIGLSAPSASVFGIILNLIFFMYCLKHDELCKTDIEKK
jgi:putative MATE family efflux protein